MENPTLIFRVFGGGDSSVGIPDIDAEIIIKENVLLFDEEYMEHWKEMIAEFYDIPKSCVYTLGEWEDMIDAERELEPDDDGHEYVMTMKERV